jgi:CDP-diacylglycerol--inositol 3-phosphatidyltransferase
MKWVQTPLGLQSYFPALSGFPDLTYAEAMAVLCFPVCFLKNVINIVQLWKASKILVGVDLAERAKAREGTDAEKK